MLFGFIVAVKPVSDEMETGGPNIRSTCSTAFFIALLALCTLTNCAPTNELRAN